VGTESPEPFATSTGSCQSWRSKSVVSAPIILQRPKASTQPLAGGSIIDLTTGRALPTCTLTADSYPAGTAQRQFLDGTNGITKSAFYYASTPFLPTHRYTLRIGAATLTTFRAAALPAGPTPVLTPAAKSAIAAWPTPAAGSGAINYYRVREYTTAGCNSTPRASFNTRSRRAAVLGLVSKRVYWIQVMAVNTVNSGRAGACVAVRAK
jgi:hypothetical protein